MTFPLNNKALLLATCTDAKIRDADTAAKLAKQCLELAPDNASAMNALACAYAAQHDFQGAIEWEEKALKDTDYKNDASFDGGAHGADRIKKWQARMLWFPELP